MVFAVVSYFTRMMLELTILIATEEAPLGASEILSFYPSLQWNARSKNNYLDSNIWQL